MRALCPADEYCEDVLEKAEMWSRATSPWQRRAAPGFRRGRSGRSPMSTIEVHEPEVKEPKAKELQVKRFARAAAVLPRAEIVVASTLPQRAIFSDSLLEFGVQRKRRFLATTTSFVVN